MEESLKREQSIREKCRLKLLRSRLFFTATFVEGRGRNKTTAIRAAISRFHPLSSSFIPFSSFRCNAHRVSTSRPRLRFVTFPAFTIFQLVCISRFPPFSSTPFFQHARRSFAFKYPPHDNTQPRDLKSSLTIGFIGTKFQKLFDQQIDVI